MTIPHDPASAHTRALRLQLAEGLPATSRDAVAPAVLRSWERAQRAGLRPADRALFSPTPSTVARRRLEEEHHHLIACAAADMQRLRRSFGSSNWVVLLVGAHGTVVSSVGHELATARELREPLRVGKDLREESLGTNAPACALADGLSTTVIGAEHYLDELQYYACAAAPIVGPTGDIVGALDVTGWQVRPEGDILRRVALSARSIENRLLRSLPDVAVLQLHHDERLVGTPMEGLIAVSADGEVVAMNAAAARMLNRHTLRPDGVSLHELMPEGFQTLLERPPGASPAPRFMRTATGMGLYASWGDIDAPAARRRTGTRTPSLEAEAPLEGDPTLQAAFERAARVSQHGLPVLVQGETGVGKEVFARQLHRHLRGNAAFVAVNCSALPEGLIEAELFGYADGAFTGARRGGSPGMLAQAQGGTLFLDEIGDMPLGLQTRLLRVLQERTYVPIGGQRDVPFDAMVLCATHRDVPALVKAGAFREDLYYRLAGYTVHLPALRDRLDVPLLIERELRRIDPRASLTQATWQRLLAQRWPGNLRQLVQTLRAAVALCRHPDRIVQVEDLPALLDDMASTPAIEPPAGAEEAKTAAPDNSLDAAKHHAIAQALERHFGNVSAAARELQLSRTTVYAHLRKHRLPR